ncbi:peptidylprolyl isomerase [Parasphingorhabdus sp.]|uniref:peptidylprolyl isomerase n=1 Tax=Parasphingorhabdus sp. TaxID=2709688 RepID=UPI003A922EE8
MADVMERISVGGVEIAPGDIAAEAQNHPSETPEDAWIRSAEALVVRRLLLDEADRLDIAATDLADAKGHKLAPDDARIEALLEQEVKTPSADEATAQRFYRQHQHRFSSPTIVEAEHILFAASPDDEFAYSLAIGDARGAIRKIQAEPDLFGKLARQLSSCPSKEQGGNLGQIGPGQTVEPFEQALFALNEGELCDQPVKSRFGVHVIRAGRRVEGETLPFEAVRQKIVDYLEEASFRKAVSQYLSILASRTEVEGVAFEITDGPLVQ